MSKKVFSLICAVSCSLIWGSAFIAQDLGMDYNGPFTFTFGRLFLAQTRPETHKKALEELSNGIFLECKEHGPESIYLCSSYYYMG